MRLSLADCLLPEVTVKKFVAAFALCLPLLGQSQTPPPPPGPASDSSLSSIREQLGLQAAQQAGWQKYETAVNAYIALYYQERPVFASENDAAPTQIRRLVDMHSNRLAALEDIETAAKGLYASLSPAQQKLANQRLLASIPVMGGGSSGGSMSAGKGGKPDGGHGHRAGGPGGGMGSGGTGNMGGMGGMGR